jgi:hypothetical protein
MTSPPRLACDSPAGVELVSAAPTAPPVDYLDCGGLVADNVVVEMVRRALIDMTAHVALYLKAHEAELVRGLLAALEVIRSMVDLAGGRRSVDLTGLGSAFGQDHDSP